MKNLLLLTAAALLAAAPASAQWSDNFDSYANGSGIIGQGGWEGWDLNPAADAFVTNTPARSAPNSLGVISTSDVVQNFAGINTGIWNIAGYCYVPSGSTGQQFFILLNTYAPGGPNNWSAQMLIDSDLGLVVDNDGPQSTPIINDQWVEVRVQIDFNLDNQSWFYNGALLLQKSWTNGASGGGALQFGTIDLFSNGGSVIYWDDLSVGPEGATAVEPTTWGSIKSAFK